MKISPLTPSFRTIIPRMAFVIFDPPGNGHTCSYCMWMVLVSLETRLEKKTTCLLSVPNRREDVIPTGNY